MKLWFVSLVGFSLSLGACLPAPAPVDPGDADCDASSPLGAAPCPPCKCPDAGVLHDAAPPKVIDAGPPTDLASRACSNLAAIKCSDGSAVDCPQVLRAVQAASDSHDASLFRIEVPKLAVAKSIADARLAGASCR